jgi:N-methylhydantoinase B
LETAGGGGYGDPAKRDRAALARDIAEGYVSVEAAEREYGTKS